MSRDERGRGGSLPTWVWVAGPVAAALLLAWLLLSIIPSPEELAEPGPPSPTADSPIGTGDIARSPTPAPTPHPAARIDAAWAVQEDRMYLVGGTGGAGPLTTATVFDGRNWAPLASLPEARVGAAAHATPDGRLFVFGGELGGSTVATVLVLDRDATAWEAASPMPVAQAHMAVAELDGLVYLIGGESPGHEHEVQVFDPASETWTIGPPLPAPAIGAAAASLDGAIYLFGGRAVDDTAGTSAAYRLALGGTWHRLTDMPAPGATITATALDGRIWVVGPPVSVGAGVTTVLAFDPASETWTPIPGALTILPGQWHAAMPSGDGTIVVLSGDPLAARSIVTTDP